MSFIARFFPLSKPKEVVTGQDTTSYHQSNFSLSPLDLQGRMADVKFIFHITLENSLFFRSVFFDG